MCPLGWFKLLQKYFAQKNWVTTGFLIFTIFWCIFRFFWYFGRDVGCLTIVLMENSNLARSKKLYLWNQKVPWVLRMRSISRPFTNIIFATQRRKAVKSLTEVQTFHISLPKNLFTGSRLEICLSGQPENLPVMHHVRHPRGDWGMPEDRAFYSAYPLPKRTQIQKYKNSKIQKGVQRDSKLQTNILLTQLFCDFPLFWETSLRL